MAKPPKTLTRAQWIKDLEKASGMSWIQFRGLGLDAERLTCRRPQCRGWHLMRVAEPTETAPPALVALP